MAEFEISATIEVDGPFFDEDAEVVMEGPEGPSAYELAVEEGFEGTLEEWLASLVGGSLTPDTLGILDPDLVADVVAYWGGLLGVPTEVIGGTQAFVAQVITEQPNSPQAALQNAADLLALLTAQNTKAATDITSLIEDLAAHAGGEDPHGDRAWAEDQLALKLDVSEKGAASGVAELDEAGVVLARHLPGYVDDVVEVADEVALGSVLAVSGRIYIALAENTQWRWSGSTWVSMSGGVVLGTTSSTAHRGDHGAAAFVHSQITSGNPHGTTAADVGAVGAARLVSTGTGLLGGGSLAADRSLSIDPVVLRRIGDYVEAVTDLPRTNTSITADPALTVPGLATKYYMDGYVAYTGDVGADTKIGLSLPVGSTMCITIQHALNSVATAQDYDRFTVLTSTAAAAVHGTAGAAVVSTARISGWVRLASAGDVAVQWAINGTGTATRLAESYLGLRTRPAL